MAWRTMRHNCSEALPSAMVSLAVDSIIQTIPGSQEVLYRKARIIAARYCRLNNGEPNRQDCLAFADNEMLWEWLDSKGDPRRLVWVVSYQAGLVAQLVGMFSQVDKGTWRIDAPNVERARLDSGQSKTNQVGGLLCVADPPVIVCLRSPSGGRFLFVDTRNYLQSSIAELAAFVDLERLLPSGVDEMPDETITRLLRDAEIVETVMSKLFKLWRSHDFGMWRWTSAGLALAAFRHRFMDTPPVIHDVQPVKDLERRAYFGGEIDCFKIGKVCEPCWQVDVNSLFPWVMLNGWFPRCLTRKKLADTWQPGPPPCNPERSIATVAINSKYDTYPKRLEKFTVGVCGKFETALCGIELCRAIDSGHVVAWKEFAEYDIAPLFRRYVSELWALREQATRAGNVVESKFVKLLLNCLYGKFGQRQRKNVHCPEIQARGKWQSWRVKSLVDDSVRQFMSVGWQVFEEVDTDDHPQGFAAISAFITAAAREYMRNLRQAAGVGNVFYQVVDSMLVNAAGLERLRSCGMMDEFAIGKLKIEASGPDCEIFGDHNYSIGEKRVEGFKSAAAVESIKGTWHQWNAERLAWSVKHAPIDAAAFLRVTRKQSGKYERGIVGPDGWVDPITRKEFVGDYPESVSSATPMIEATSSIRTSSSVVSPAG